LIELLQKPEFNRKCWIEASSSIKGKINNTDRLHNLDPRANHNKLLVLYGEIDSSSTIERPVALATTVGKNMNLATMRCVLRGVRLKPML